MKATIDEQGRLTVSPDNALESYALSCWWEDWNNGRVCLHVEYDHPHVPGAMTSQVVLNSGDDNAR